MSDGLSKLGRAMKTAHMIRIYRDGDGRGFVWRWWNPLTWVSAPLMLVTVILLNGIPKTFRHLHEVGLRMKPWFVEHPDKLEWLP